MPGLWFSWIKEDNVRRTGTIFWVYMCCSPARGGVSVLDSLTRKPLQIVLGPVLSLQRRKRRIKMRLKPKLEKTHSIYKGAGGRESKKRWRTEGLFLASLRNLFRTMLNTWAQWEPLGYEDILPLACSPMSSGSTHITHKISNSLLRQDRSQHPLWLFATSQASSVAS